MNCSVPCAVARWHVGGELQAARPRHCARHGVQVLAHGWGCSPLLEHVDLARVDVQADHVIAHFGQAGAGHQADVAAADHGYFHCILSTVASGRRIRWG
jgi:hypothetical protein